MTVATLTECAYYGRRKTGRCANGGERGKGRLVHAVPTAAYPSWAGAACGAEPGRLTPGWSDAHMAITCQKCLKLMAHPHSQEPKNE